MSSDPPALPSEETLDPDDWGEMRALGHRMVDDMMDYLQGVRDRPVWRPVPAAAGDDGPDGQARGATELEVLVADPAGQLSVYLGAVRGARVDLATDAVVRTATAAEVAGARRTYGLVQHDLMWAMDLAAFGNELQSYASGRLSRQDG